MVQRHFKSPAIACIFCSRQRVRHVEAIEEAFEIQIMFEVEERENVVQRHFTLKVLQLHVSFVHVKEYDMKKLLKKLSRKIHPRKTPL